MRYFKAFYKWLNDQPVGFSADGRMIGLSMSAAMDDERQRTITDVEDYLSGQSAQSRGTTTSR